MSVAVLTTIAGTAGCEVVARQDIGAQVRVTINAAIHYRYRDPLTLRDFVGL